MDRREFMLAGALAATASSVGWLRGGHLAGGARAADVADANASAPSPDVFAAIVGAMLPFEDLRFGAVLSAAHVTARATKLFSIDKDPGVQQNLAMFDDMRQFAAVPATLAAAELALYPADEHEKGTASPMVARAAMDAKAWQAFSARWKTPPGSFTQLSVADQRAYLMLWARSGLGVRRRFYQSIKSLAMVATYSMDEVWPVIGYAGPLLHLRTP